MRDAQELFRPYADEVRRLLGAASTTEETYYPAIKSLLSRALEFLKLPFEARTSTAEVRAQRGLDLSDFALYDGPGEFLVVCGDVKLPDADLFSIRSLVRLPAVGGDGRRPLANWRMMCGDPQPATFLSTNAFA